MGMGKDALMLTDNKDEPHWTYKVKDHGLITAVASLGMINIWNFEDGQASIAEYLNMADGYAKQGALLAIGLMNLGIRDDIDTAKGILIDAI